MSIRMWGDQLHSIIRWDLKRKLAHCTEEQLAMFKRMYAAGRNRAVTTALREADRNDIVDDMPDRALPTALLQVEATLKKNGTVVESLDLVKFLEAFEKEKAVAVLMHRAARYEEDDETLKPPLDLNNLSDDAWRYGAEMVLAVLEKLEDAAKEGGDKNGKSIHNR
jgi:hypothetical protein